MIIYHFIYSILLLCILFSTLTHLLNEFETSSILINSAVAFFKTVCMWIYCVYSAYIVCGDPHSMVTGPDDEWRIHLTSVMKLYPRSFSVIDSTFYSVATILFETMHRWILSSERYPVCTCLKEWHIVNNFSYSKLYFGVKSILLPNGAFLGVRKCSVHMIFPSLGRLGLLHSIYFFFDCILACYFM